MATRWSYSFSNLGPKKRVGGTTFYKVQVGSQSKWLSMQGIKMLEKAHDQGVKFKDVMKATSFFTGKGTQNRMAIMRRNIRANWAEYTMGMELGDNPEKLAKGLKGMAERHVTDGDVFRDMDRLLQLMTEDELRTLARENKLLLSKYFADSEPLRGATATEEEVMSLEKNVNQNARMLRDKMLEILSRRQP